MDRTELLSRERLAGYDPERLERAVILLVGAGAAGCNIALDLALSGVGELRVVDFDHVEASNVSRAPLFRRERLVGGRVRHKARELAQGFLAFSYAANPLARFAVAPVQALGLGAFQGVDVVISAVDGFRDRAWLSDAARACGVPFIEVGFSAPRGHVSVFPNRSSEEPGWRCLMPGADTGGISCALYARSVCAGDRKGRHLSRAVSGAILQSNAVHLGDGARSSGRCNASVCLPLVVGAVDSRAWSGGL